METEVVILEIMSVLEEPPQAPGMPDRLTELEPQISSLPHCRRWLSKMERRALCSFQLQEPEQGERAAVSQPEILDQPYQLVEGEAFCTSPGPLIRSSNISGLLGWKKSWQRESPQVQISKWASLFEGFIDSWGKHGCRHISLGRNLMEECANTVTANKKRCAQLWLGTGRGQEVCQKKSLWTFLGFWLGLAYQ
nr:uncharacterized protein LOC105861721 isoform X7 [Microcebus murinus]